MIEQLSAELLTRHEVHPKELPTPARWVTIKAELQLNIFNKYVYVIIVIYLNTARLK